MNKINKLLLFTLIAASVTSGAAWAQSAANYPTKAVRFIAPFPPGGSTDLLARLVAQKLTEAWGQQVIVENRGGAGGTIGVELAARAAPDGYTIVMGHVGTFGFNPTLYPKLPYDAIRDFAPITVLATVPNGMAVHPSLPVKTARDFVALAKAKPGELLYASGGSGSASHLAGEYFKLLTKINMVHVPYKGTGPAMISMISGQTTMTITGMVALMPHVKSGRLKLLGVATMKRLAILPEVPTINESGAPGYDANQWYGVLTQAAVPRDIVMKLHADIVKVLARADVKDRLAADGAEAVANTPEQFAAHIKAEIARWAPVVKASGAKPD
jgi:tripartite-type tricarboxylate transporter receptor subunit TctC